MELVKLNQRYGLGSNNLIRALDTYHQLISELGKRGLPAHLVQMVNRETDLINHAEYSELSLLIKVQRALRRIFKKLEKETKLVPRKYYTRLWTALGMAVFGVPLGVAFGASLGNMAFLAIGLPVGLAIGMAVGTQLDKKASESGYQLDVDFFS